MKLLRRKDRWGWVGESGEGSSTQGVVPAIRGNYNYGTQSAAIAGMAVLRYHINMLYTLNSHNVL